MKKEVQDLQKDRSGIQVSAEEKAEYNTKVVKNLENEIEILLRNLAEEKLKREDAEKSLSDALVRNTELEKSLSDEVVRLKARLEERLAGEMVRSGEELMVILEKRLAAEAEEVTAKISEMEERLADTEER